MKNTQNQKGSAAIIVIIIVLIVAAALYFSLRKSGDNHAGVNQRQTPLTMEEAGTLAIDTVIDKKITSLSKDCLKALIVGHEEQADNPVMFYEIHEVHNTTCGGDPNTSPIVSAVQINTQTGTATTIDVLMQDDMEGMPGNTSSTTAPKATSTKSTQPSTPAKPATNPTPSSTTANTKEFTITAANYSFTPNVITVKKGDTVKINLTNSGGFHDFKIDEFSVATKKINGGATDSVTFVASKAGSFEFYCSVGSHRAMGMKGTLVVQ